MFVATTYLGSDLLFYVYIHKKCDTGEVFYIGKGGNDNFKRARSKARSEYWKRVVAKHGRDVEVVQEFKDEDDAFLLEMWLIAKYRHNGIPLVNITNGGEGRSGMLMPESQKKYMSDLFKGVPPTSACIAASIASSSKSIFDGDGNEYSSITDAARKLFPSNVKSAKCGISGAIRGRTSSYKGVVFTPKNPETFNIVKKEVRDEIFRKVYRSDGVAFDSIQDAALSVSGGRKMSSISPNIHSCCSGRVKTAYGYGWSYDGFEFAEYTYPRSRKGAKRVSKIIRSDGKVFDTQLDAALFTSLELGRKVSQGPISSVCLGKQKKAYGYGWSKLIED